MTDIVGSAAGGLGSLISGTLSMLLFLGVVVVIALVIFNFIGGGNTFKLIIFDKRGDSAYIRTAKGQLSKDGKLKISSGFLTKSKLIEMPKGKNIFNPNTIILSKDGDDYKVLDVSLLDTDLKAEPALSPGMVLAHVTETRRSVERLTKQNPLEKYAGHFALILASILLVIGFWIGFTNIGSSLEKVSSSISSMADKLDTLNKQNSPAPSPADVPRG